MSSRIETTADSVKITRTFDAPPDLVFAAFVEPERLEAWAGCPGTTSMNATGDVRVGGEYRHVLQVEGCGEDVMVGEYTEVDPPRRLAYTQSCEPSPGMPEMPQTLVTVDIRARDGKTEVCLVHSGLATQEMRDNVEGGWSGAFEKLARTLGERAQETNT